MHRLLVPVAVTLAIGSLLTVACGAPAGGDPGGRRLYELGNDRVFDDGASATLLLAHLSRTRYSLSGGVAPVLR